MVRSALILSLFICGGLWYPRPAAAQSNLPAVSGRTEGNLAKRPYTVIGEKAVLYSRPSLQSKPIGEFRSGATVVPVRFLGEWAEIDHPDHGYVKLSSLVDRGEKREEGGAGSFDLSKPPPAAVACPRERELEEELRRKDDRIRELEKQLERQGGVRPELPPRTDRGEPLGAVTPPRTPDYGSGYDSRNMMP